MSVQLSDLKISGTVKVRDVWGGGEPAAVREALSGAFGQNEAWGPAAVTSTIRKVAPRDTVVTVDSGAHRFVACHNSQRRRFVCGSSSCGPFCQSPHTDRWKRLNKVSIFYSPAGPQPPSGVAGCV